MEIWEVDMSSMTHRGNAPRLGELFDANITIYTSLEKSGQASTLEHWPHTIHAKQNHVEMQAQPLMST
eukprot:151280-Amphidinium_carterae.1